MKKYEVKTKMWDDEEKAQVYKVIGSFDDFVCALLFAKAYEKHYSTQADLITYVEL